MSAQLAEKLVAYAGDLTTALRKGWLGVRGYDEEPYCVYCDQVAQHSMEVKGYVCKHEPGCLMVKYASLVGDVNDGED